MSKKTIDKLSKAIQDKGMKVVFGLEAQGHIPTIEAIIDRWNDSPYDVDMKYSKCVWEEIGKKIGWCPFTAALHYFNYLDKN